MVGFEHLTWKLSGFGLNIYYAHLCSLPRVWMSLGNTLHGWQCCLAPCWCHQQTHRGLRKLILELPTAVGPHIFPPCQDPVFSFFLAQLLCHSHLISGHHCPGARHVRACVPFLTLCDFPLMSFEVLDVCGTVVSGNENVPPVIGLGVWILGCVGSAFSVHVGGMALLKGHHRFEGLGFEV